MTGFVIEVYILKTIPKDQDRPTAATLNFVPGDKLWASATELGNLGPVLDQDWDTLRKPGMPSGRNA